MPVYNIVFSVLSVELNLKFIAINLSCCNQMCARTMNREHNRRVTYPCETVHTTHRQRYLKDCD